MHQQQIEQLKKFQPKHDFFIGIDSDGCVFDTMEIKQKECFIPNIVKHFDLQMVSKYVRECAEFVNLYSMWRGANRYPALLKTLTLTFERPEVRKRGLETPDLTALQSWIQEESKLGLPALRQKVQRDEDPFLQRVLAWSEAVDATVEEMVKGVGAFPYVEEVLQAATGRADMIVVSQTPTSALVREWREHKLERYVQLIAGQELGTKTEHLQMATDNKYPSSAKLMIGDAPGDLKAARQSGCLFFPVMPGDEEKSWERLLNEGLHLFFEGQYAGEYENRLVHQFEAALPSTPPWQITAA